MAPLLTPLQMAIAEVANAHWDARLGTFAKLSSPTAIANFQREHGLSVDGIAAPPTRAAEARSSFAWPTTPNLLIGGTLKALPKGLVAVAPGYALTLSLEATPTYRLRTAEQQRALDLLVLHWDECQSSLACFHTLLWRRLSAHLLIDCDGTIFQTLDLRTSCAYHARTHNPRSVGIEINNPLYPGDKTKRPLRCEKRAHTQERWHIAGFTNAQHETLKVLVPWLCETLGIPNRLPLDGDGEIIDTLIAPDFAGVCGHFHLQKDKVDPGFALFETLKKQVRGRSVG